MGCQPAALLLHSLIGKDVQEDLPGCLLTVIRWLTSLPIQLLKSPGRLQVESAVLTCTVTFFLAFDLSGGG